MGPGEPCLCSWVWTVWWERDPAAAPTANTAGEGDPGPVSRERFQGGMWWIFKPPSVQPEVRARHQLAGDEWPTRQLPPDVIKSVSTIPTENSTGQPWAKIATISARAPWVLHGSRLNSIQITEVESRKNVYMAASSNNEELGGLAFLDCNTLLLCCAKGQLCLADIRQPQSPLEAVSVPSAPCGEQWCMGVGHQPQGSDSSSQPVACLSSGGHLTLTDVRKTSESLASVKCRVPSPSSGAEFLCVSWAPALEGCLAVSGFDGTVHVYNSQSWDSSGKEAEPIFVHKGHVFSRLGSSGGPPPVTVHTWHPQKPRTLLSAASDGSLHVWDWVGECG
ncbi:WD repeat-containing protein 73 isoform X3 [Falco biarmicus]|uniref:WD repeat-containing protein 73 isoform X3 n=1 Tax=Falco biarmicus TaxID=345155 RepID=UPI0024BCBEEC|nr:WD repeat-containing protein 73 isoform X3 [Falco biarmicus]